MATLIGLLQILVPEVWAEPPGSRFVLPKTALDASELAVVVNDGDALSVEGAAYYQKRRGIPAANMIHVQFPTGVPDLSPTDFARIKAEVDAKTPRDVQAFALAWTAPYRVGCMGITSAFAFGFDEAYCSKSCQATKPSPYFNSSSYFPYRDHEIRPSMMLAGLTGRDVRALIDRGISSDHTYPRGTGYLVKTTDKKRAVRWVTFADTVQKLGKVFKLTVVEADIITHRRDVLFYFTGGKKISGLFTLGFLPGAMADHLTSAGGQLTDSSQMSALRWLDAGVTASYGTVVEPCNHLQKFPYPLIALWHYANGESLIEAYWKSVAWPGEGVFIGEPLARPFEPSVEREEGNAIALRVFSPETKQVWLESSVSSVGPFRPTGSPITLHTGLNQLSSIMNDPWRFYRLGLP